MKKLLLSIAAILLSAGLISAQEASLQQATELFNNGAKAFSSNDKTSALDYFQKAYDMAKALGDEGAEILKNCSDNIPKLYNSLATDLIKETKYDEAIAQLEKAVAAAKEFGVDDALANAQKLIPQAQLLKGNALLTAKDYEGAAEVYKAITDADPANGMAALRLGMALNQLGKADEAIAALKSAAENGQAENANKQLGSVLLKEASNFLRDKDYQKAFDAAVESAGYAESANAFKIAGTAANSLSKKAEAIEYLGKYLELSPNASDAAQIKAVIDALKK
ncbi:MAG: tetratricopeptide repeat protein [Bacteroidales bacterium]|nr:tetratricopeptide repeat protein [Bacteroidales bacterium]